MFTPKSSDETKKALNEALFVELRIRGLFPCDLRSPLVSPGVGRQGSYSSPTRGCSAPSPTLSAPNVDGLRYSVISWTDSELT